jgi:hypothetical protein
MSATQLLEKLGSSALLQRGASAEAAAIREQALQHIENIEKPIPQWCIVVPAEDEGEDAPSEGDENENSIHLN